MERLFFRAFSSMGAGFRALGASLRRMEERRRTRGSGPGWPFLGAEPYTGAGPLDSPEC